MRFDKTFKSPQAYFKKKFDNAKLVKKRLNEAPDIIKK